MLVPGLYLGSWALVYLEHQLRNLGLRCACFGYPTMRATVPENAGRLAAFAQTLDAGSMHFVGHSLGGLVIRAMFSLYPERKPGRIVTLGTPHNGSYVAQRLHSSKLLRWSIGKGMRPGLLGDMPDWDGVRELGSIAGSIHLGMGRIVPGLEKPNDGTVSVAETRLANMAAHIVLPVTHSSMLLSTPVAARTAAFLNTGRFEF